MGMRQLAHVYTAHVRLKECLHLLTWGFKSLEVGGCFYNLLRKELQLSLQGKAPEGLERLDNTLAK